MSGLPSLFVTSSSEVLFDATVSVTSRVTLIVIVADPASLIPCVNLLASALQVEMFQCS